jgi:cell division transport system permease protein
MSWQTARGYCWSRAMRMLGERPLVTLAAVGVCALALAIPGCALMLAQAFAPALGRLPVAEISAFVAPGTSAAELKALATRIEAIDGVARVRLIPRDQAWAEMQRRSRDGAALAEIKPNPLPDVLVAEFPPHAPAPVVQGAVTAIGKQPRVDSVQGDIDWYRRLLAAFDAATTLFVPFGLVVGLFAILVTIGSVRVTGSIDARELRLLDQIGAEIDFIRRPFVYAGAVLLGLAGALALGLIAAAREVVNPGLAELGRLFGLELVLRYPPWPLVIAFVAACLLLGGGSGWVFAHRQMAFSRG